MHRNSILMFQEHAVTHIHDGDRVLEVGADNIPSTYQKHTSVNPAGWDTIDFAVNHGTEHLTYVLEDPYTFPVPDNTYDVVLSGQVIEHVPKPWRWLPELARVARAGGRVITIAPVSWPYHEAPVDCWRCYPIGLAALYEEAGLEVVVAQWGSLDDGFFTRLLPPRFRQPNHFRQRLAGLNLLASEHLRRPHSGAFDTVVVGLKH